MHIIYIIPTESGTVNHASKRMPCRLPCNYAPHMVCFIIQKSTDVVVHVTAQKKRDILSGGIVAVLIVCAILARVLVEYPYC